MVGAHLEKTHILKCARITSPRQDSGTCSEPMSQKHTNCKNQPDRPRKGPRKAGCAQGPDLRFLSNVLSQTITNELWLDSRCFDARLALLLFRQLAVSMLTSICPSMLHRSRDTLISMLDRMHALVHNCHDYHNLAVFFNRSLTALVCPGQ